MRPAHWLSFYWSPERQEFSCDGERFAHPIATNTSASHDVAHLLLAASGLPWRPKWTRDEVCFAEFNAVFLEHLAVRVLDHVLGVRQDEGRESDVLDRTLDHARWFAEVHYAPFPVSFEEALARFGRGLDLETTVRLAPVLLRTRLFELEHVDFRSRTLRGAFSSAVEPQASGVVARARELLAKSLDTLARARFGRGARAPELARLSAVP